MYTGDLSNVMELLFFAHVDNTVHQEDVSSGLTLPLLLILGYTNGFHVWTIPVSQLRYNFKFINFLFDSMREAYMYMYNHVQPMTVVLIPEGNKIWKCDFWNVGLWRRRTWEKNLLILMINNFITVIIEKYDVIFR